MNFESLFAETKQEQRVFEDIDDPVKDYVLDCSIDIFGVPDDEDIAESIYNGDTEQAVRIGTVTGIYVLGSQLTCAGFDLLQICDDHDAYSEYIISALLEQENELPLSIDDPEIIDVFCIDDILLYKEAQDSSLRQRIIEALPQFLLGLYHHTPDLLAVYPEPLPYEKTAFEKVNEKMAEIAFAQAQESILGADSLDDRDIRFIMDEEKLNIVLGRRRKGQTYPEAAKDLNVWKVYENAGFTELGNSRVLIRD
ncbi:hypothetical protein SAMN02910317_02006 [Ruminococcaceae bacterium FB2012]|nr:hypothetical protein SAMN02910317_02006 [Ruminococcaceae bacterium FB2012]